MFNGFAEFHGFRQVIAALAHQPVIVVDDNAVLGQLYHTRKDIRYPVEQRAGQHSAFDSLAGGVGFVVEGVPGNVQFIAGGIDAGLGMMECAACQVVNQRLAGKRATLVVGVYERIQ